MVSKLLSVIYCCVGTVFRIQVSFVEIAFWIRKQWTSTENTVNETSLLSKQKKQQIFLED